MPIEIIVFAIPLIIIHYSLVGYSLHNLFRSKSRTRKVKIGWTIIVLILNLIGPLLYIFFGREKFNVDKR
ncbi:MAG: PLDc N-terminal domain-containing protein [Candidatus Thorarchaeota archaeon]